MRRRIKVRGQLLDVDIVKAKFRAAAIKKLNVSEDQAEAFAEHLMAHWDEDDFESLALQADNKDRPALIVNVTGHDPIFASVLNSLASVTDHKDTAAAPNIAIRHAGHAETMLRRLRYGDILAMQAMHHVEARPGNRTAPLTVYAEVFLSEFMHLLLKGDDFGHFLSQHSTIQKFAIISDFCRTYGKYDVRQAFNPSSSSYCGLSATTHGPNVHSTKLHLDRVATDDRIAAAAIKLLVNTLNDYNRNFLIDVDFGKQPVPDFAMYYVDRGKGDTAKGVIVNGDQATEEPAEVLRDTGMGVTWRRQASNATGAAPANPPVGRSEPEPHEEGNRESPRSNILHGDSQNIGDAFRRIIGRAFRRNEDEHIGGPSEGSSGIFEGEVRSPSGQSESESDAASRRGRELFNTRYCGWYYPPYVRGTNVPNLSQDFTTHRAPPFVL